MNDHASVETIRFVAEGLTYVEAGRDFRDGMRSYDSAVTGRLQLLLDDRRLFVGDIAPATFDVSQTAVGMYRMLEAFRTDDYVRATPFCCVCGTQACAYIRWELERIGTDGDGVSESTATVRLTMETLAGDPIGDHRYVLELPLLRAAVADLAAAVVETAERADATELSAGTLAAFREWGAQLRGD